MERIGEEVVWNQSENREFRTYAVLQSQEHLLSLRVEKLRLQPEYIEELGRLVGTKRTLQRVEVNGLHVGSRRGKDGIAVLRIPLTKLFVGLRGNEWLRHLTLESVNLSDGDVINLCRSMDHNRTLLHLDISSNPFLNSKGFGVNALAAYLATNRGLRTFRAHTCAFQLTEASALFDALGQNGCLTTVSVADNPLGEAYAAIAKCLRQNRSITALDLAHVNDRDGVWKETGMRQVLAALADNDVLHSLDLSGSNAGDAPIAAVGSVWRHNRSLAQLSLCACSLTDTGVRALLDALAVSRSLQHLNLRRNRLSATAAHRLMAAAVRSPSLTRVDVWENEDVPSSLARALDDLYASKMRVREVRVVMLRNDIVPDISHYIAELLHSEDSPSSPRPTQNPTQQPPTHPAKMMGPPLSLVVGVNEKPSHPQEESMTMKVPSLSFYESMLTTARFDRMCALAQCSDESMSVMRAVQSVECARNAFSSLPQNMALFSAVTELRLSENRLAHLDPGVLLALPHLRLLDLRWNHLTHVPDLLATASALDVLLLSHNPLSQLPAALFSHAYSQLDLAHTPYGQRRPWVGRLCAQAARLDEALDLSALELTDVPAELLSLTQLRSLDLSRNRLAALPARLGRLTALTTLDLSHNQLLHLPPHLAALTALSDLRLEGNPWLQHDYLLRGGAQDLLKQLRGLEADASRLFHRIVVVGPKSSGKSSLLSLLHSQSMKYSSGVSTSSNPSVKKKLIPSTVAPVPSPPSTMSHGSTRPHYGTHSDREFPSSQSSTSSPSGGPTTTPLPPLFGVLSLKSKLAPANKNSTPVECESDDERGNELVHVRRMPLHAPEEGSAESGADEGAVRSTVWELHDLPMAAADLLLHPAPALLLVVVRLVDASSLASALAWVQHVQSKDLSSSPSVLVVATTVEDRPSAEKPLFSAWQRTFRAYPCVAYVGVVQLSGVRGLDDLYRELYGAISTHPRSMCTVPAAWLVLDDLLWAAGHGKVRSAADALDWLQSRSVDERLVLRLAADCGVSASDVPRFLDHFAAVTGALVRLRWERVAELASTMLLVSGTALLRLWTAVLRLPRDRASRRKPSLATTGALAPSPAFASSRQWVDALKAAGCPGLWLAPLTEFGLRRGLLAVVQLDLLQRFRGSPAEQDPRALQKNHRSIRGPVPHLAQSSIVSVIYEELFSELKLLSQELSDLEESMASLGEECIRRRFGLNSHLTHPFQLPSSSISSSSSSSSSSYVSSSSSSSSSNVLHRSGRWVGVGVSKDPLGHLSVASSSWLPSPSQVVPSIKPNPPSSTLVETERVPEPEEVGTVDARWFGEEHSLFIAGRLQSVERPAEISQLLDSVGRGLQVVRYLQFSMLCETHLRQLLLALAQCGEFRCTMWLHGLLMVQNGYKHVVLVEARPLLQRVEVTLVGEEVALVLQALERAVLALPPLVRVSTFVPCSHCLSAALQREEPYLFPYSMLEEHASKGLPQVRCRHPWNTGDVLVDLDGLVPDLSLRELARFQLACDQVDLERPIAKGSLSVIYEATLWIQTIPTPVSTLTTTTPTASPSTISEKNSTLSKEEEEKEKEKDETILKLQEDEPTKEEEDPHRRPVQVAVKQVVVARDHMFDEELAQVFRQFRVEAFLLSRLNHPNIVGFHGFLLEPLSLVMEYMQDGNLYDHIRTANPSLAGGLNLFDWPNRLAVAEQVAAAMAYLHGSFSSPILHRDLKSANVLLAGASAKVADFGLSVVNAVAGGRDVDNPFWLAVEVIRGEPHSTKSDVFSFAIILWELLTLRRPYSHLDMFLWKLEQEILAGLRPLVLPEDVELCPYPPFVDLMRKCWDSDPDLRPSFDDIHSCLKSLLESSS